MIPRKSKGFPFTANQLQVPLLLNFEPEPDDLALLKTAADFLREVDQDRPKQSKIWEEQINKTGLAQLEKSLLQSDFAAAHHLLENFWLVDNGKIGATYVNFKMNLLKRLKYAKFTNGICERFFLVDEGSIEDLCVASGVGNPAGYPTDHGIVNSISTRHTFDARSLARLSNGGALLEIGGGHGGLGAKVIESGSFAKYIDCDLPIMLCVAYYFLSKTFPAKRVNLLSPTADVDTMMDTLDASDVMLMSAFKSELISFLEIDGVFNSYSFSEMTGDIVASYIASIEKSSAKFVLHENYSGLGRKHPHLVSALSFPFSDFKTVSSGFTLDPKNLDCQRYLLMR